MRPSIQQIGHWLGGILTIFGIAFIVLRLNDYSNQISFNRLGFQDWAGVGIFSLAYGISNLMLAYAWHHLLNRFGANITYQWALQTYGFSQLAKYVPGNIFHLAGRQSIGMAAGVSGWPLAKASMWELCLLTVASILFGLLALPLLFPSMVWQWVIFNFVASFLVVGIALDFFFGKATVYAFSWHVCFFAISVAIFVGLLKITATIPLLNTTQWLTFGGAYVLAWLVGFITPGTPAGIGVREATLYALLYSISNQADLLVAILLFRVVSIAGDLLFFLFAAFIKATRNQIT